MVIVTMTMASPQHVPQVYKCRKAGWEPQISEHVKCIKFRGTWVTVLNSRFTFFLWQFLFLLSSFLLSLLLLLLPSFSSPPLFSLLLYHHHPSISRCFKNSNEEILSSSFGLGCCLVRDIQWPSIALSCQGQALLLNRRAQHCPWRTALSTGAHWIVNCEARVMGLVKTAISQAASSRMLTLGSLSVKIECMHKAFTSIVRTRSTKWEMGPATRHS